MKSSFCNFIEENLNSCNGGNSGKDNETKFLSYDSPINNNNNNNK